MNPSQGMPGMPGSFAGEPGAVPTPPMGGEATSPSPPPPPPPVGGVLGEDPHEKIMASLLRIEEKLAAIAAKIGT